MVIAFKKPLQQTKFLKADGSMLSVLFIDFSRDMIKNVSGDINVKD